jgi:hypothetical protein
MMEAVDNHFTRQYNPEDSSEHHTRRRENLKSHHIACHSLLLVHAEVKLFVRPEVLTAARMKITAFWDIAPSNIIGVDRRFRSTHFLRHHPNYGGPAPL